MLKNILKLNGAQQLSKNDQKTVNGGMLTVQRCDTSIHPNCYCNGTPGIEINMSNCDGITPGAVTNSPSAHCPVILVGGTCYGCA